MSDCAWLAPQGEYRELAKSLLQADPRLRSRDPKATRIKIPWPIRGAKVTVLEAQGDEPFRSATEYTEPSLLRTYLSKRAPKLPRRRTVLILEGLDPGFIDVLGSHLDMHPSVFVDHERNSDAYPLAADNGIGPATASSRLNVTIRYVELVKVPKESHGIFSVFCAKTGRHIAMTRTYGDFSEVGMARRKCSVWKRVAEDDKEGKSWDCVVLTDPQINAIRTSRVSTDEIPIPKPPIVTGYMDFMPHEHQIRRVPRGSGPPRTCMGEDLVFYLTTSAGHVDMSKSDVVTLFVNKIATSHFITQSDFLRETIASVQWKASSQTDALRFNVSVVERQWSDAQRIERRMVEYVEYVEANMLQLGIAFEEPLVAKRADGADDRESGWQDVGLDYQFVYKRFGDLRRRAEALNSSITALASIAGNRQALKEQQLALDATERSIREARSARALTFVGLVFIPLAYTASLFSMADPYGPGSEQFWLYFTISVPLILFVLVAYFVVDLGYGPDGMTWQFGNVWKVVKGGFRATIAKWKGKGTIDGQEVTEDSKRTTGV